LTSALHFALNVFDGSWWNWGERKLQGGGMSPILTLDLGDRIKPLVKCSRVIEEPSRNILVFI